MNTITSCEKLLVSVCASSLDSRGQAAVVAESYRDAGQLQLVSVVTGGEVTLRNFLQGGRLSPLPFLSDENPSGGQIFTTTQGHV